MPFALRSSIGAGTGQMAPTLIPNILDFPEGKTDKIGPVPLALALIFSSAF